MKIIIGTANFNEKYGFIKKKFDNVHLNKLGQKVKKDRLFIDTAENYNNYKLIKNLGLKKKIFSKFKICSKKQKKIKLENLKLNFHLKQLDISKFYGLMFHDSKDVFSFEKKQIKKFVLNLKKRKITKFVGISVYSPSEVKKIIKFFKPDFIQFPLNIFDKRFISKENIKFYKQRNIKLVARSCFLQGIILRRKFLFKDKKDAKIFNNFKIWLKKKKLSALSASLNFIKNQKDIDFLVIGIDNYFQLKQITEILKSKKKIDIPYFQNMSLQTIDPRLWKK